MKWYTDTIIIQTSGKGLYPFSDEINKRVGSWDIQRGICVLFIQHTSASLIISESYDPTARLDLEAFMDRLIHENESWHRHILEGSDDSPSHMRAILTNTNETIPIEGGKLQLGLWQGIYLFEHRKRPHTRKVLVYCLG